MLNDSLLSLRQSDKIFIVLVSPNSNLGEQLRLENLIDMYVQDSGGGLSTAINEGIAAMPKEIDVVSWLGDDDEVFAEGLMKCLPFFLMKPDVVATYGVCEYFDEQGNTFWVNDFGQLAVHLLRFGPDRIPQPGSLLRRDSFNQIGMLAPFLKWAFDLDMFIKLSKIGKVLFVPVKVSRYRWHPSSLSSSFRDQSNEEARNVRVSHLPTLLAKVSPLWENPQYWITEAISNRLDRYSR
jgi:hypothetical protein